MRVQYTSTSEYYSMSALDRQVAATACGSREGADKQQQRVVVVGTCGRRYEREARRERRVVERDARTAKAVIRVLAEADSKQNSCLRAFCGFWRWY